MLVLNVVGNVSAFKKAQKRDSFSEGKTPRPMNASSKSPAPLHPKQSWILFVGACNNRAKGRPNQSAQETKLYSLRARSVGIGKRGWIILWPSRATSTLFRSPRKPKNFVEREQPLQITYYLVGWYILPYWFFLASLFFWKWHLKKNLYEIVHLLYCKPVVNQ